MWHVFNLPWPKPNILPQWELSFHIFLHVVWCVMDDIILIDQYGWRQFSFRVTALSSWQFHWAGRRNIAVRFLFSFHVGKLIVSWSFMTCLVLGQKRMCGCWKHPLSEQLFNDSSKKKVASRLEVWCSQDPAFGTVLSYIRRLKWGWKITLLALLSCCL